MRASSAWLHSMLGVCGYSRGLMAGRYGHVDRMAESRGQFGRYSTSEVCFM